MKRLAILVALWSYAASPSVAAAPQVQMASSTPLKPSDRWMVDYADNMCTLQRNFGRGDASVLLGFKPGPFSESVRMILVWKGSEKRTI